MKFLLVMAITLIHVTGPNGNRIDVNPADIVSLRKPPVAGFYDIKVKCVIYTLDGQFIGTQETCEQVRELVVEVEE